MEQEATKPPRPGVLITIALAGIAAGAGAILIRNGSDNGGPEPGLQAALLAWIIVPYVVGGAIAWWRRPESRLGPLMVVAGAATFLSTFSSFDEPLPFTIGQALDLIPFPLFLHVFLAFPSGRLRSTFERVLVGIAYFVALGLQMIGLMLGGLRPDNILAITTDPAAAETLFDVQLLTISAVSLAGLVVLVSRRRSAGPPLRQSLELLVDSFGLALVMIAVFTFAAVEFPEWGGFLTLQRVMFFTLGFAPVAFLIALIDARLARSAIGDLMIVLRRDPTPGELPEALGKALNDPSLQLAYWLPQFGTWGDDEGREVALPDAQGQQATTLIRRDGRPVAALIHDRSLAEEPELLDAVTAAAGIAVENGRLHAELRAGLEELRGSRERVIEAEQDERKRLERNLHDGAQQRLIALSLDLARLGNRLERPDEQAEIKSARAEIAVSLGELRDVARGLHPAVLSGHGLEVALESLVAASTVPVRLRVTVDGRLDEPVEVAAFYVVSESLANVGKHAQASSATVDVNRENGQVVVEIVDDGIGGADSERGSGIRGLADRVEAVGGRLRVWTPRGGGTRVRAEMPCG